MMTAELTRFWCPRCRRVLVNERDGTTRDTVTGRVTDQGAVRFKHDQCGAQVGFSKRSGQGAKE